MQAATIFRRRNIDAFWRMAVIFILLITVGSQFFQPLLSTAQKSETFYVKTLNNATVYSHTSYYNVTGDALAGVSINSQNSFSLLAKLAQFSGGTNSISTVSAEHCFCCEKHKFQPLSLAFVVSLHCINCHCTQL
jgi:hypothetical protein